MGSVYDREMQEKACRAIGVRRYDTEEGEKRMAFFDARQTQKDVVSPEVAECDMKLAELEQERQSAIFQIGQVYVENNDPKAAEGTPYEELRKEVARIEEETEALEKRKLAVQGLRKCEKCGNILVLESGFCNICGEKLGKLFVPTQENPHICSRCGEPYEEGMLFCTGCGNKLG